MGDIPGNKNPIGLGRANALQRPAQGGEAGERELRGSVVHSGVPLSLIVKTIHIVITILLIQINNFCYRKQLTITRLSPCDGHIGPAGGVARCFAFLLHGPRSYATVWARRQVGSAAQLGR